MEELLKLDTNRQNAVKKLLLLGLLGDYRASHDYKTLLEYQGKQDELKLPDIFLKLNDRAFRYIYKIKRVELNEHLREIGSNCFTDISSLVEVKINDNLLNIGEAAFRGTGLTSFKAGKHLSEIARSAFEECENLQEVELNDKIFKVGSLAFAYTSIKEIVLPSSLAILGADALHIKTLQDVYVLSDLITVKEIYASCCSRKKLGDTRKLRVHFPKSRELVERASYDGAMELYNEGLWHNVKDFRNIGTAGDILELIFDI